VCESKAKGQPYQSRGKSVEGVNCNKPKEINKAFIDYYQDLFSPSWPTDIEDCLEVVHGQVALDKFTTKEFTIEHE
jgi:hypothetical protein